MRNLKEFSETSKAIVYLVGVVIAAAVGGFTFASTANTYFKLPSEMETLKSEIESLKATVQALDASSVRYGTPLKIFLPDPNRTVFLTQLPGDDVMVTDQLQNWVLQR